MARDVQTEPAVQQAFYHGRYNRTSYLAAHAVRQLVRNCLRTLPTSSPIIFERSYALMVRPEPRDHRAKRV